MDNTAQAQPTQPVIIPAADSSSPVVSQDPPTVQTPPQADQVVTQTQPVDPTPVGATQPPAMPSMADLANGLVTPTPAPVMPTVTPDMPTIPTSPVAQPQQQPVIETMPTITPDPAQAVLDQSTPTPPQPNGEPASAPAYDAPYTQEEMNEEILDALDRIEAKLEEIEQKL